LKPRAVFKLLLISTILVSIIAGVVAAVSFSSLPAPLLEYLQTTPVGPVVLLSRLPRPLAVVLSIVVGVIEIASFIGLWRFRRWGRTLYVAFNIFYVLCLPFMGPLVLPPSAKPLFYVDYLLQGALIATAYLPPIANVFATQEI